MKIDNKPILEFVAIKRRDCGEWAIPGVSIELITCVYSIKINRRNSIHYFNTSFCDLLGDV